MPDLLASQGHFNQSRAQCFGAIVYPQALPFEQAPVQKS
jgi:hypothetical protein